MALHLTRPLCTFDIESTGTNITKDRIVEICILKVNPDKSKESKTWLINPGIPIPKEVTEIHGITDEHVKDAPSFKEVAPQIMAMLKGADIAGFNSIRFDVPFLAEEMLRVGIDFDLGNIHLVDVQHIYHKMEPRNLSAAYRFYCHKELTHAHSAEADTHATYEILEAQVEKYEELPKDIKGIIQATGRPQSIDFAGMIGRDAAGHEIFNFGKYKGQRVADVFQKDTGYYSWILNADFPLYTKKIFTAIQLRSKFQ